MQCQLIPFCTPKNIDLVRGLNQDGLIDFIGKDIDAEFAMQAEGYEIYFDFIKGFRLKMPHGNWRVKIWDSDSEFIFFDDTVSNTILISVEKFFIRWEFEIYLDGQPIFHHVYNPAGFNVHFHIPSTGMGDHIALLPCIEEFCRKWNCTATCRVEPYMQEILNVYFPEIKYSAEIPADTYASYHLSPGFSPFFQPTEVRKIPMLHVGREILGLGRYKKKIYYPTKPRQIAEPYVCIAAQGSITPKAWLNPDGYDEVVAYLKSLGYRVLCIDKNREETSHGMTVKMPQGAEDFTGDISLIERVNLLAYADFFIGLSSGLSWLAWAVDIPVILISGITSSWFEFDTPYRIINRLVCNSCHNDTAIDWPQYEFCPYHNNTPRAYECSRMISARQVIDTIEELRVKSEE